MDPARADRDGTAAPPGTDRYGGEAAALPEPLRSLFAALAAARLDWCLLRPAEALLDNEGDIDLLVDPSDRALAGELAKAHDFVPMPVSGDLHAALYDPTSDRFLWLHIQDTVRIGSGEIPAAPVLGSRRAGAPGSLPQPRDDWLFWIVLLHDVLDKGAIPDRHRAPLAARLAGTDPDCPEPLREIALTAGLDPVRLLVLTREARWKDLVDLAPVPNRRFARQTPLRRLRGIRAWRGLSVAVVGPDGAGKTTLVEGLARTLPFPTRVIYMGLTGGRLPRADALRVPGLVLTARLVLLWARYALGLHHTIRGRIALFDRYPVDGLVPSGRPLRPLARLSRRVQAHAVPAPDLLLLLDASGAAMHARKGEYDPDQLESWRAAYGRLRSFGHVAVLDAEQPADTVRRQAAAHVWQRYAARWAAPPVRTR